MLSNRPSAWRPPLLSGIVVFGYKSLGDVAVIVRALTILVGRNGSGKSNFLDAIRFISDSLQTSLDHAIRARGVLSGLSRLGAKSSFSISFALSLPNEHRAQYSVAVATKESGELNVHLEKLIVKARGAVVSEYEVHAGKVVRSSINQPPPAQSDRLYLVIASGFPAFRPVYDAISSMRFYDFNADVMRRPQAPDIGGWLRTDGSNVASVVAQLSRERPEVLKRITQYLSAIVPGIVSIERVSLGPVETLKFNQRSAESAAPQEFFAWNMSDGTLRALGALVAVAQTASQGERPSLVCIEEPETSLHPAAAAALMDGLREYTEHTQIIITSHSPDLLDQVQLDTDTLLVVAYREGVTKIAPIDEASVNAIRSHLYTPGELLRLDQLEPDRDDIARQESSTSTGKEEA
jgi:predicted ATPase